MICPIPLGHILFLYIMVDLFNYTRRASSVAHIGAIDLGGDCLLYTSPSPRDS